MPSSTVVTKVVKETNPSKRVLITFNDGSQYEFTEAAQIQSMSAQMDSDLGFTQRLLIALWYARSPTLNANAVVNKTFTFDLSQANPITLV
jgi:hypothetical protein